jgi:hypothetical protein
LKKLLFILFILTLCDCKKKQDEPEPAEEPVAPVDTGLGCRDLPSAPQPFGWTDTTIDPNQNIMAFVINPVNPDEAIIVVEGDIYGYNKMYNFHIPTRNNKYLASLGEFPPQVNKRGWILYSNAENNIFKVKTNGDSSTQLTFNKRTFDPKWDYTGKNFYYLETGFSSTPSYLVKRTSTGGFLNHIEAALPNTACFKKSDKILFLKARDTVVTLFQKNLISGKEYGYETALLTASYSTKAPPYFDDLTVDNNDLYFYWSNTSGVFRHAITGGTTEQILKNCGNYKFINPLIVPSAPDELTVACHFMRPLDSQRMFHEFRPYQVNLSSRQLTWIKLFQ